AVWIGHVDAHHLERLGQGYLLPQVETTATEQCEQQEARENPTLAESRTPRSVLRRHAPSSASANACCGVTNPGNASSRFIHAFTAANPPTPTSMPQSCANGSHATPATAALV